MSCAFVPSEHDLASVASDTSFVIAMCKRFCIDMHSGHALVWICVLTCANQAWPCESNMASQKRSLIWRLQTVMTVADAALFSHRARDVQCR